MFAQILLVDDDLHILKAAEFKLKRTGHEVRTASDGEEAWAEIEREVPDLVITDLQMPRLDGLQLVRRIRQNSLTERLPVILLTAKGFEVPRDEAFDREAVLAVVPKPFSPRELCQHVQRALESCEAAHAGLSG